MDELWKLHVRVIPYLKIRSDKGRDLTKPDVDECLIVFISIEKNLRD